MKKLIPWKDNHTFFSTMYYKLKNKNIGVVIKELNKEFKNELLGAVFTRSKIYAQTRFLKSPYEKGGYSEIKSSYYKINYRQNVHAAASERYISFDKADKLLADHKKYYKENTI